VIDGGTPASGLRGARHGADAAPAQVPLDASSASRAHVARAIKPKTKTRRVRTANFPKSKIR